MRTIDTAAEKAWALLISRILHLRFEHSAEPVDILCNLGAREVFRDAYNSAVAWINGSHADLRPWLVRYRELCCRVALKLQIASDPTPVVLTPEAAVQAGCVVHWMLAQLVEAVQRVQRGGNAADLSAGPTLFEVYEHAPPNGGPLSVRIRRPGSVDEPARKLAGQASVCPFGTSGRGYTWKNNAI